ncbi:hypothetical protein, partial [Enterobacter roggenkampii]|uniref:hypothetical protein n=1 Tax=Enterobacter roggenkampii TaxID=1812935 RepID=UPI00197A8D78
LYTMSQIVIMRTNCGDGDSIPQNAKLVNTELMFGECQCGQGGCGWNKETYEVSEPEGYSIGCTPNYYGEGDHHYFPEEGGILD